MATSALPGVGAVHPEDRAIMEELAKLKESYDQLLDLRELLPDRLMTPLRSAFANPQRVSPLKLATHMREVVQQGTKQLDAFSKQWHSDEMRVLWQKVNTGDFPQGQDIWNVDYKALVSVMNEGNSTEQVQTVNDPDASRTETDETVGDILKHFSEEHTEVRVEVGDNDKTFPIGVTVAEMDFLIEQAGEAESTKYRVMVKPASQDSSPAQAVAAEMDKSKSYRSLSSALQHLAAYHDIRTRECSTCHRLFNDHLELPRIRTRTTDSADTEQWQAFHLDCANPT